MSGTDNNNKKEEAVGKSITIVGEGFLGRYLTRHFLMSNILNKVIAIDKASPDVGKRHVQIVEWENNPRFKYLWNSAGDPYGIDPIILESDAIIYTAALADVPYVIKNPLDAMEVNVKNTTAFMEYLRQFDYTGKLIMCSSESVYGHQKEVPIKEDVAIPKPHNLYGASKLGQETVALTYAKSYGIKSIVLRSATMFGPYGRRQQAIPIFIKQALMNEDITLEGDGNFSRDFNYVTNMVDAVDLVVDSQVNDIYGQVYNIGTGEETYFNQLVKAIKTLLKSDSKIVNKPFRPGEKDLRVCLDISKAKQKFGYEPVTSLLSGIRNTSLWLATEVLGWSDSDVVDLAETLGLITGGKKIGEHIRKTNQPKDVPAVKAK